LSATGQTAVSAFDEDPVSGETAMSSSSFDPETIATLQTVLDSTVELLPLRLRTPASTVNLASQLLTAAAQGHRSKEALVEIGTRRLTLTALTGGFYDC
jgi:hypothetical protein